jgi:hypothetical protein
MKSIGIVFMHLRKMLLQYEGMVPIQVGQGGYRKVDTMVRGVIKKVGQKIYVGIQYSLRRNSRGV